MQTIYNWRKGKVGNLKLVNVLRIVERYKLELRWLVMGKGPMYRTNSPLDAEFLNECIAAVQMYIEKRKTIWVH